MTDAKRRGEAGGKPAGRAAAGGRAAENGFPQILRDLLAARGPSGYETAPAAVWRKAAKAFGAQVSTDVVGTPRRACPLAARRGQGA